MPGRISSGSPGSQRGEDGCPGTQLSCLFFLACRSPPVLLHVPKDSSGSDSFVHPFPLLPLLSFLLPLSNYSLVSSPAGRSFFEKTTERVLDPHTPTKNTDLSPIPTGDTRPLSYVFSPRLVHTLDLHLQMLFLSSCLQIPALTPCMCPICYLFLLFPPTACISLEFLPIPSELTSTRILHPILSV
jgi:hypothetical protein